jgi:hypothetical protein
MEEYDEASNLLEPELTRYMRPRLLSQHEGDLDKWCMDYAQDLPAFCLLAKLHLFIRATTEDAGRMLFLRLCSSQEASDPGRCRNTRAFGIFAGTIALVEGVDRAEIEL